MGSRRCRQVSISSEDDDDDFISLLEYRRRVSNASSLREKSTSESYDESGDE
jgi:hypothetical protein